MPADLKHFRTLTTGKNIIMGLSTYESIGRPLPNRRNIVLSRKVHDIDGVDVAQSITEAYALAGADAVVVGGGSIYEQTLDDMDRLYVTEVQAEFSNATVFFPEIGPMWVETSREHHDADEQNKYAYDFVVYDRR